MYIYINYLSQTSVLSSIANYRHVGGKQFRGLNANKPSSSSHTPTTISWPVSLSHVKTVSPGRHFSPNAVKTIIISPHRDHSAHVCKYTPTYAIAPHARLRLNLKTPFCTSAGTVKKKRSNATKQRNYTHRTAPIELCMQLCSVEVRARVKKGLRR